MTKLNIDGIIVEVNGYKDRVFITLKKDDISEYLYFYKGESPIGFIDEENFIALLRKEGKEGLKKLIDYFINSRTKEELTIEDSIKNLIRIKESLK
jgi:hypothetical protein